MIDEIRYPKKGDKPFKQTKEPLSPTWCSLEWLRMMNIDDSLYASAFKKAADLIIDGLQNKEDDPTHPDMLFMPITYLYRHCLELKMKHIISVGQRLDRFDTSEQDKVIEIMGTHNLHRIWSLARKVITETWSGEPQDELDAVESVIQEFNAVDKSGQNLRYSKNKNGEKTSEDFPSSVQLAHMKTIVDSVYRLLDGCVAELLEELGIKIDMMNDLP